MGAHRSEPKAMQNAIARIRPRLSELDNMRTDGALAKVHERLEPQLKIDGWTVQLKQKLDMTADEASKLIEYFVAVAEPSGGRDHIDWLITRAVRNRESDESRE